MPRYKSANFELIKFAGGVSLTGSTNTLRLAGGVLILPSGTAAAPALGLGASDYGLYKGGVGPTMMLGGAPAVTFYSTNLLLGNLVGIGFVAGDPNTTSPTLFLSRETDATLQMGADSATPAAQMFKGADGSGADKAGGDITLGAGRSTGTGAPGVHYIATSTTGAASNSTQQALVNRVKTTETGVEVLRDNLQSTKIASLTELTTIAAAATTDTTIQIPANAIVLGVSVRVTTVIPTAAMFTVIGTTTSTAFQTGANVSTAADTTDVGTKACPYLNTAAQTIRFTPNAQPADNSGRVRVTIHYILITAPTS